MALTKVNSILVDGAINTDASGNVGIGTSSPDARLRVNGGQNTTQARFSGADNRGLAISTFVSAGTNDNGVTYNAGVTSDGQQVWQCGGTERMRIDTIGNLLVGTTTSNRGRLFSVSSEAAIPSVFALASNASFTNAVLSIYAARNTTNGSYELISAGCDFVATRFRVLDNGNVQNTNSSYGGISDIKLKENIVDATPKLEDLCKVKVRSYNFKNNTEDKQIGVVAQELEEVFPGMVEELIDRDEEGNDLGTKTKAVKYSVFVPMLIKAIQEQQAIITDLKARIETLEAK